MALKYLRCFFTGFAIVTALHSGAQRIRLEEGSLNALRGVKSYSVTFDYDSMTVSRKRVSEQEYVNEKIDDLNDHHRNQGDNWAAGWRRKRQELYEPAFLSAMEYEGLKCAQADDHNTARYQIIFKTKHTETGYNIGIKRRSSRIDGEAWIIEAEHPERVLAKISVKKCLGKTDDGYDFNSGQRLIGSYEVAGSSLAQFLKEKD